MKMSTRKLVFAGGISLAILFSFTGCIPVRSRAGVQTQTALNMQATMIVWQSSQGVQVTVLAQQVALLEQATTIAQQATQLADQSTALTAVAFQSAVREPVCPTAACGMQAITPYPPTTVVQTSTPLSTTTPTPDVAGFRQAANILLFEDMSGDTYTTRYVKQALDGLQLQYVDVADGQGNFKKQLLSPGSGGKNWDLIISADENRASNGIKGEFFNYFNQALDDGAAVIIETWRLDEMRSGVVDSLLQRCGITYQGDLWALKPGNQVLINLAPDHSILNEPNKNISLRIITEYWKTGDLGDWVQKTPGSQAVLLLGTRAGERDKYGTLTVCTGGRLILQTFSTHQYDQSQMVSLWQNYIYNALVARMVYLMGSPQ